MPLTDLALRNALRDAKNLEKQAKLFDQQGLYALVHPRGAIYWRYEYDFAGARRTAAYGVYPEVSLAEARELHAELRALKRKGIDPQEAKRAAARDAIAATENTFEAMARAWHANRSDKYNEKTEAQILRRLEADIFPLLGRRPIAAITPPELVQALRKVLKERGVAETVKRLRQYIGGIFRYGVAEGVCERDIAADITEALKAPPESKPHASLPSSRVGEFLRDLNAYAERRTVLAMKLIMHTFVRTNELRLARWEEFDLEGDEPHWIVPAERMKKRKKHYVPLTPQAVALLAELKTLSGNSPFVFPGTGKDGCMSSGTLDRALERLGYEKVATVHGFRTLASTYLNEKGYNADAIEAQLAHRPRNKVRDAYNRAEYLPERWRLMRDWSDYLEAQETARIEGDLSEAV